MEEKTEQGMVIVVVGVVMKMLKEFVLMMMMMQKKKRLNEKNYSSPAISVLKQLFEKPTASDVLKKEEQLCSLSFEMKKEYEKRVVEVDVFVVALLAQLK